MECIGNQIFRPSRHPLPLTAHTQTLSYERIVEPWVSLSLSSLLVLCLPWFSQLFSECQPVIETARPYFLEFPLSLGFPFSLLAEIPRIELNTRIETTPVDN